VRPLAPIIRHETARLSVSVWGGGRSVWDPDGVTPEVDQLQVREIRAPDEVGVLLGDSSVWARSRRYLVGGQPVMLAVSYVPVGLADGTRIAERDSGPGGVYARLAEAGSAPARFAEDVWADMPGGEEIDRLGLDYLIPVLRCRRVAFDKGGSAVECSDMTLVSWAFRLRFDFPA
jgi:GntR family transcriptional regulator